ncbi:putative oxidoreductase [Liparis tanakae]|uniref:Putative oxidoreductase n=1 Tax=Liparis tanakae TaxID=230148 RepID=A0A4Z2EUN8_9TELE|nr:putative oxidoreductase [Liparis tanakae]
MAAPVALIQGASRGLGLQFCRHILKSRPAAFLVATCRNPEAAAELRDLAAGQRPGRVTVLRMDVTREEQVRAAADRVAEAFGRLDLLVNSAGMLHPSGRGETRLSDVSAQVLCVALHPGTVDTALSRPYRRSVPSGRLFGAERSVELLMSLVDALDAQKSGRAFSWDGAELPW